MEYCVKVELPIGETDQYWTAFVTSWGDKASARRDQNVIQQHVSAGHKTTILKRDLRVTVCED